MEELSLQAENCIKEVFYEGQKSKTHTQKKWGIFYETTFDSLKRQ